mmetsp:Transcript_7976/g.11092  ORF Transcript_7976/g.11092 Transcript_7976/m.11092 type:complete len:133 (+) Transcript_7976:70-468(+)
MKLGSGPRHNTADEESASMLGGANLKALNLVDGAEDDRPFYMKSPAVLGGLVVVAILIVSRAFFAVGGSSTESTPSSHQHAATELNQTAGDRGQLLPLGGSDYSYDAYYTGNGYDSKYASAPYASAPYASAP